MSIVAWRVTDYDNAPVRREFVRETGAFYIGINRIGKERAEKKQGQWWRFFSTEEEALLFISSRNAAKDQRKRDERQKQLLQAAAPELLKAVTFLADALEDGHWSETKQYLRELIAKATGEQ